jgi:hypothetical protein
MRLQSSSALSPAFPEIEEHRTTWVEINAYRVLIVGIAAAVVMKFTLTARLAINWDEFYYLEIVHRYVRGELGVQFQTFYVHFFSWLPLLGWDEVDQIVTGRLIMAVLGTGTAFLIYIVARRFVSQCGALFALLAYLSVTAVVGHSASFRADPIVTFLSLLSVFAILCEPGGLSGAALAGLTMALGVMVTVKLALHLAVMGAILWCVAQGTREFTKMSMTFLASFSAAFAVLYLLHDSTLAAQPDVNASAFLHTSASKVFFEGFFPRSSELIQITFSNPLFWLMMGEGATAAWTARQTKHDRSRSIWLPLVLALPVLTPIVYRNAFIYFYPVILAPASILVGFSFDKHLNAARKPNRPLAAAVVTILVIAQCTILALHNASRLGDRIHLQRQTIAQVRTIFPQSVHYIGGFGILAGYPRDGFFMSSWGLETYRRAGEPVFPMLVARDQPPFLLADSPSLYDAMTSGVAVYEDRILLTEDAQFLRENYVPYWGMLFVAGKRLPASPGPATFNIAISGEYRLDAATPLSIDGKRLEPGDSIVLAAGEHRIDFGGEVGETTLRWAQASQVPALAPTNPLSFFNVPNWAGMTPQMMQVDAAE